MSPSPFGRPDIPRLPVNCERLSPSSPRKREVPRYKLVLQRESCADLMAVVRGLMEVAHFPRAEATHKMWEAHHAGRSVVLVTHLERAELFVEQFAEKGVAVSIEPR